MASTRLVAKLGLPADKVGILELDVIPQGDQIQGALHSQTGQRTVPNVFINGKHIGGNSDLQALSAKGQLQPLLAKA